MASTTGNYNLRKPDITDTVDVTADIADNMDAIDAAIVGKADTTHTHTEANVTNLTNDLAGKAATSHTHTESDVTNLASDLSGKAATSHTHAEADVTSLTGDLAAKAAATHTHAESDVTNLATDLTARIANTLVDAKGDLLTATADNTPARLAVGTNGNILVPDSTATTGLKWTQLSTRALTNVVLIDDFISQNTASGDVGQIGWKTGGSGTTSVNPGEANHPGILVQSTGSVSAQNRYILTGDGGNASFIATDVDRFMGIFRITAITNVTAIFGLTQDGTAPPGTAGVYFIFDPATNANWQTVTRAASTSTTNTSTVAAVANNWFQFEGRRNGSNWEMYINGTLRFTHSTNLPTVAVSPVFFIQTNTTTNRDMNVDFFALSSSVLGQRWT